MIIKSQSEQGIVIMSNNDTIAIKNNGTIVAYNGGLDTKTDLGSYSTSVKAKKVLNMICE